MSKIKFELLNNKKFMKQVEKAMKEFIVYIQDKFKNENIYIFAFGMAPAVMGNPYDCILYVNTEEYYNKKILNKPNDEKDYYRYCAQEWKYMGYHEGFDKLSDVMTDFFGDMELYGELEADVFSAVAEAFSKLKRENVFLKKDGKEIFITFCRDECHLKIEKYSELVKKLNVDNIERQKYLDYIEKNYKDLP